MRQHRLKSRSRTFHLHKLFPLISRLGRLWCSVHSQYCDIKGKSLEDLGQTVPRNVGHRWVMLRFDLPRTKVKFVHAIGGKKHVIKRDIWTTWRQLEQCVLVGRDRSRFSLILILFAKVFSKTANTVRFLVDGVQFWFFALIYAPRFSAIPRALSQIPHLFVCTRVRR